MIVMFKQVVDFLRNRNVEENVIAQFQCEKVRPFHTSFRIINIYLFRRTDGRMDGWIDGLFVLFD